MKKVLKMFTSEKKTWLHTPFELTTLALVLVLGIVIVRYVLIIGKGAA